MTSRNVSEKKGFELDRDLIDGHDAYVLVNPENGRYVYTYFSRGAHGRKALGNGLLHTMSEQLGSKRESIATSKG